MTQSENPCLPLLILRSLPIELTMRMRSQLLRFSTLSALTGGLFALAMPGQAFTTVGVRDYQTCAASLRSRGISEVEAASACAAALYPRDVARCVADIAGDTTITTEQALAGCRRSRRPVEVASCVVSIAARTENVVALEVLDNCRRSLLPVRFSACVVGLSAEISLSPAQAMNTCIAAGDRPRNVLPSFVPASSNAPQPITPIPLPAPSPTP